MSKRNKNYYLSELYLLMAAVIWGMSFVAQRQGMEYIGPFTFNAGRCLLGALTLLPIIYITRNSSSKQKSTYRIKVMNRHPLLFSGTICGLILFFALSLQQAALVYTTAGKAAFITALYIVLVPVFGFFLGAKTRKLVWVCVVIAIIGFYLLSIKENFGINRGDLLSFISSFFYAAHIIVIGAIATKLDGIKMLCIQFFVAGSLSLIVAIGFEDIVLSAIIVCIVPIIYTGVMNSAVAYILQIKGQEKVEPSVAALILSMEAVLGLIGGVIFLHETMTGREMLGCAIVFLAILLSQLPEKKHL